jgi:hypothetical protein
VTYGLPAVLAILGLAQIWAAQVAARNVRRLRPSPSQFEDQSYEERVDEGFVRAKGRLIVPFRLTGAALMVAAVVVALVELTSA